MLFFLFERKPHDLKHSMTKLCKKSPAINKWPTLNILSRKIRKQTPSFFKTQTLHLLRTYCFVVEAPAVSSTARLQKKPAWSQRWTSTHPWCLRLFLFFEQHFEELGCCFRSGWLVILDSPGPKLSDGQVRRFAQDGNMEKAEAKRRPSEGRYG